VGYIIRIRVEGGVVKEQGVAGVSRKGMLGGIPQGGKRKHPSAIHEGIIGKGCNCSFKLGGKRGKTGG